jgi:hypothetical protein
MNSLFLTHTHTHTSVFRYRRDFMEKICPNGMQCDYSIDKDKIPVPEGYY